jgi:hypothetical protein
MNAADQLAAWIAAVGGRRFILCVGEGLSSKWLLITNHIDQNVYFNLIALTVGAFVAAHAYETVKTNNKDEANAS